MMYATADSGSRSEPRHLQAVPSAWAPPTGPLESEPLDHATVELGRDEVASKVVDLYEQAYVSVARLAYLLVADRHLAEDLAHDAFTTLYERWADLDDESKAGAYLRATVTNLAMSSHRRKATARRHLAAVHDERATAASAEAEAMGRSCRPDVVAALQSLSAKQRGAVVLRYWLRYTESEIAEALGCSVGSVRTHLHRGHAALAQQLGGDR